MDTVPHKRTATLLSLLALAACTTPQQQKREQNQAVKTEAAQEIRRICALPEAERKAEIEKVKKDSGMTIVCSR